MASLEALGHEVLRIVDGPVVAVFAVGLIAHEERHLLAGAHAHACAIGRVKARSVRVDEVRHQRPRALHLHLLLMRSKFYERFTAMGRWQVAKGEVERLDLQR